MSLPRSVRSLARWSAGLLLTAVLAVSPAAQAATVTLKTADGQSLQADATGAGKVGVVLLHGEGRTRADWSSTAANLVRAGIQVVAVDLRGHGGSPLAGGTAPDDAAFQRMTEDIAAAVAWLRSHGAAEVTLVGVDVTASLALQAGAADPQIRSVVMVSPRLSGHGVKVTDALARWTDRPLLLVAGTSDTTGVRAAGALAGNTAAPHRVQVVADGTTGPGLFARDPDTEGLLIAWVKSSGRLGPDGLPATTAGGAAPTAGAAGSVETTGTRIGEQPKP